MKKRSRQLRAEANAIDVQIYEFEQIPVRAKFLVKFGFGVGYAVEIIDNDHPHRAIGTMMTICEVALYKDEWYISLTKATDLSQSHSITAGWNIDELLKMRESYLNSHGLSRDNE